MAQFLISDVEKITGVKAHILRYWEETIPFISPQKNIGGRRTYSMRDIQLIKRLRYLIQEKKFTIEGALDRLIEEANIASNFLTDNSVDIAESISAIKELRSELIEIYNLLQKTHQG